MHYPILTRKTYCQYRVSLAAWIFELDLLSDAEKRYFYGRCIKSKLERVSLQISLPVRHLIFVPISVHCCKIVEPPLNQEHVLKSPFHTDLNNDLEYKSKRTKVEW